MFNIGNFRKGKYFIYIKEKNYEDMDMGLPLFYDMIHGGQAQSMNILWNQLGEKQMAHIAMFSGDTSMYGGFYQYMSNLDSTFNSIMDYSLKNYDWQLKNQYGVGCFDANGKFIPPVINYGSPYLNNMYNNGFNTPSPSKESSKAKTKEERVLEEESKTIESFLKKLAKYLGEDSDGEITTALKDINNTKDISIKDKNEKLKNLYKELKETLGKDDIIDFLISENSKLATNGNKDADSKNSIYEALKYIDYDNLGSKSASENGIDQLRDAINKLGTKQENLYNNADLIKATEAIKGETVLAVISQYNGTDKDLMSDIIAKSKYDTDHKGTDALINSLLYKAKAAKRKLDNKSETEFKKLIDNLENCKKNNKYNSNMTKAFNELYAATRMIEAKYLEKQVIAQYSVIDPDIFKEGELFTDKIKDDLISEKGIGEATAKIADNYTINLKRIQLSSYKDSGSIDKEEIEEQIQTLVDGKFIEEDTTIGKIKIDGEETKVYVEVNVEDGKDPRYFAVVDDKIYTLKLEQENLIKDKEIKASKIKSDGDKVIEKKKKAEEKIEKAEKDYLSKTLKNNAAAVIKCSEKITVGDKSCNVYSIQTDDNKYIYFYIDFNITDKKKHVEVTKNANGNFTKKMDAES